MQKEKKTEQMTSKIYETTKYWEGEMIIMPTGEEVAQ